MPDVADEVLQQLAPAGVLVAAINYGNPVLAQRAAGTGEPAGVSVALARKLGERLGVPVELKAYATAGLVANEARSKAWSVAFLAIDAERAADIAFTQPYVLIEGTYMVPEVSPIRSVAEVDRAGIRIAVGLKSAYDLYLTRAIGAAELQRWPTVEESLERFVADGLEAAAGVREALVDFAEAKGGLRVLPDSFMTIRQAMATPAGNAAAHAYLERFIAEQNASYFVARELAASGRGNVTVAP